MKLVRKTYCFEKSLKIHEMWYTDSLKTKRSLNDFYHYLKSVRKTYCFENFESLKIHEITSTECRTIYLKKMYLPVSQILCCQLLQTSQDTACWRVRTSKPQCTQLSAIARIVLKWTISNISQAHLILYNYWYNLYNGLQLFQNGSLVLVSDIYIQACLLLKNQHAN